MERILKQSNFLVGTSLILILLIDFVRDQNSERDFQAGFSKIRNKNPNYGRLQQYFLIL